ncbi:MAG: beta-ketoacyl-ACP synthase III [Azospirillaceae bacterium]
MTTRRSIVAGIGSYLPQRVVTNDELATMVDTSDEWIVQRTGIKERHFVGATEKTSDMALAAARPALAMAGLDPRDLDLIVLATTTPDQTFPATAATVQAELGMTRGTAFDVQAVCTGFIYALSVADAMLRCGHGATALVIGAESFSRILDFADRSTCVLFGDGAGAVVLTAGEGDGTVADRGVLSTHLHTDGRQREHLYVDGGPSTTGTVGHVRMNGREVFKHAVVNLAQVVDEAMEANGLTYDAIDWLIPHQANRRIIEATARKLGLSPERVVMTVERHANTSAASVPLALTEAVADGRIKQGDLLLLEAMGGGFTWGSALVRW